MALILFHAVRLDARLDQRGSILLIEEQDRSKWDLLDLPIDALLFQMYSDNYFSPRRQLELPSCTV